MVKKKTKKIVTLAKLKQKTQVLFNKRIRDRDIDGEYFTCISCGKTLPKEKCQAGHCFPVKGYDHMRYNPDNVNGECQRCNGFDGAHLIFYVPNLIKKIGQERWDALLKLSQQKPKIKPKAHREAIEKLYLSLKNNEGPDIL